MAAAGLAALPAAGAWEELRRNDAVRLSIDPKSIRVRAADVSFRYLVDFREPQGDYKTAVYRSLANKAAIRCKARTIAMRETEAYAGNEAKGPLVGVMKPPPHEARFHKIELGTSDEDLWKRVCPPAKPAAKADAKK